MLQTEEKKTPTLPFKAFCAMFDWAADQLRIAIPRTVHRSLVECRYDEVPLVHESALDQFKRMPESVRADLVKKWFDRIEPGYVYNPSHTGWF